MAAEVSKWISGQTANGAMVLMTGFGWWMFTIGARRYIWMQVRLNRTVAWGIEGNIRLTFGPEPWDSTIIRTENRYGKVCTRPGGPWLYRDSYVLGLTSDLCARYLFEWDNRPPAYVLPQWATPGAYGPEVARPFSPPFRWADNGGQLDCGLP